MSKLRPPRHLRAVTDDLLAAPSRLRVLDEIGLVGAEPQPGLDRLVGMAARVTDAPIALVSLIDPERQTFAAAVGLHEPLASSRQTPLSHSFCQHVVRQRAPLVLDDARQEPLVADNPAIEELGVLAYAGVPLNLDGEVLGSLCAIDSRPRPWGRDDIAVLEDLAAMTVDELDLRRMARRLQALSRTDALTGLPNRRVWEGEAPVELARAQRHDHPLCMAMIEIDREPRSRGRRSLRASDDDVRALTEHWRRQLRAIDLLARLEGDRFALMLGATPLDPAFECLQRLQRQVAASRMDSASGMAMWRQPETLVELSARVEGALSRAQRSHRPSACHLAI